MVGEVMRLVTPVTCSLLLLMGGHPCTLLWEIAVVAPPTHIVMGVVVTSLGTNLSANRRRGLIRCPGAGVWLLDGSQSTFPHAVWRSITPGSFGDIIIFQYLLLPQR